jgi:hypothetical protein
VNKKLKESDAITSKAKILANLVLTVKTDPPSQIRKAQSIKRARLTN